MRMRSLSMDGQRDTNVSEQNAQKVASLVFGCRMSLVTVDVHCHLGICGGPLRDCSSIFLSPVLTLLFEFY